ncbi:MAG: hypothetical protein JO057_15620, partial [Chloroflexi bacterium]|nr:hypothetical protein [Chloroflexota bacterium]
MALPTPEFELAPQLNRVPSMRVPLDGSQELRFQRLMDDLLLIDVHQHPMVLAADANEMPAYFRGNVFRWGFEAVKAGGWTAVATANVLSCFGKEREGSFSRFEDLVDEVGMMLADVHKACDSVVKIGRPEDILSAQQSGKV